MTKKNQKSNKIPEKFEQVVTVVEKVCAEFDSKENFRFLGAKRWIRDVKIGLDDQVRQMAFVLDIEQSLLAAYVVLRLPDVSNKLTEILLTIARINFGLLPGCFELDLESGEVRFRSELTVQGGKATIKSVAQLLAGALLMTRTYAPAFQKIIESDADPLETINEIEGS